MPRAASPPNRRQLLAGLGGALVPLPSLPSLDGADPAATFGPHPLVVVRTANGVAQEDGDEPERFWPRTLGALTSTSLAADTDRATSELARHAERLLLVRGTTYPFRATGELHAGGGNQMLTAARPGPSTGALMTYAQGESVDNRVARAHDTNLGEPLTLFTGQRAGFGEEVLSYRGPGDLRAAEDDPWLAYQRLLGGPAAAGPRAAVQATVVGELAALLEGTALSEVDRRHLELHLDSVSDFEALCRRLSAEQEASMADLVDRSALDDQRLVVARLHCDLVALALACDRVRAVTLQIGDRADNTSYVVDGVQTLGFHSVSHRTVRGAPDGEPIVGAQDQHHAIDRQHLQVFGYLLDLLVENGVLERAVVVFGSDIGAGDSHSYTDLPWIVAGRGDGTLATGRFVDAGGATHERFLNTVLTATGLRGRDGGPITDFGDPSLVGGLLDEIRA